MMNSMISVCLLAICVRATRVNIIADKQLEQKSSPQMEGNHMVLICAALFDAIPREGPISGCKCRTQTQASADSGIFASSPDRICDDQAFRKIRYGQIKSLAGRCMCKYNNRAFNMDSDRSRTLRNLKQRFPKKTYEQLVELLEETSINGQWQGGIVAHRIR
mmetsp:Transcript_69640/g.123281  ORF Transcript_69640/g.123281 Transcript_69640/m.123281 type:complete len:162 (-) Transcript_69640:35-520(-)